MKRLVNGKQLANGKILTIIIESIDTSFPLHILRSVIHNELFPLNKLLLFQQNLIKDELKWKVKD